MRKLFFLFLLPLQLTAQDINLEKLVDSLLVAGNRNDVPGTMVLIARDGKPVFQKAYGMASLEFSVPLTTNHVFAVGSVSKQFTGIAILQLQERGKLKVTDDIRKYLPKYNTHGQVITIANLLTHTSGISSTERKDLPEFRNDNGVSFHHNEFLNFAGNTKLIFQPGTSWSYNNIAFMLATVIVEKVSGQAFGDYLRDNIFLPAGMTQTYLINDLTNRNNVAESYVRTPNSGWRNDDRDKLWGWEKGAGGIMSTLQDMLKWDIAIRENKVLSAESLQQAWTPYILRSGQNTNYGLGWYITRYPDYSIISHGGAVNAYRANSIHIPEKKLYVFYVGMNGADYNTIPKKIVSRLLNVPTPVAEKKPSAPLTDYVGTYNMHYAGSRVVKQFTDIPAYSYFTTSGDTLYMRQTMGAKTFLRPAGIDRFLPAWGESGYYVFQRNQSGQVTGVKFESYLFAEGATGFENKKLNLKPAVHIKTVTVPADTLKKYAGTYYNPSIDSYLFIETENGKIYGRRVSILKFELVALSNNKFKRKEIDEMTFTFSVNKNGTPVVTVTDHQSLEYRKIGF